MSVNLLHYFLFTEISAFFLIFCRIGAAMLVLPGFSDVYVPQRVRLLFALLFSLSLTPLLGQQMPPAPASLLMLGVVILREVTVGVFIGMLVRTMVTVTHVAGNVIASQSSLSAGSMFDPTSGAHSPMISNIIGIAAITLFFVLDLHHLVLAALVHSYDVFTPGNTVATDDMARMNMRWMADAFSLGVLLAAPHIIFSLIFYLLGGLMARLMPNFQVFFVFIPPQILLALLMMMALIPLILEITMSFFENRLLSF